MSRWTRLVVFCVSVVVVSFLLRRFSAAPYVASSRSLLRETNMVLAPPPPTPPPSSSLGSRLCRPCPSALSAVRLSCPRPPFPSSASCPFERRSSPANEAPRTPAAGGGGYVLREGSGRRPIRAKAGWPFAPPPKWLHRTSHPGVLLPRRLQATTDGRGLGGAHGATFFDHARHRQLRVAEGQQAGRL